MRRFHLLHHGRRACLELDGILWADGQVTAHCNADGALPGHDLRYRDLAAFQAECPGEFRWLDPDPVQQA